MKRKVLSNIFIFTIFFILSTIFISGKQLIKKGLIKNFGNIPIYFIKNEGQVNNEVKFYAKTRNYTLWITKESLIFDSIYRNKNEGKREVVKIKFPGMDVSGVKLLMGKKDKYRVNYFIGRDKSRWFKNVPTSRKVFLKNIYRNIDLKLYGNERKIEYDFIVNPGGNVKDIAFEVEGNVETKIDEMGNLKLKTPLGELIFKKPLAYQEGNKFVESKFVKIGKNRFGFSVGKYHLGKKLIIDPVVVPFSTYLGGSSGDEGYGIAVDSSGYAYVTGYTNSGDFPIKNGYQENRPGTDIFITKFSKDGTLIYSTYLGGNNNDYGYGIAVDSNGCACVTGCTYSDDFPLKNSYQGSHGGNLDVFLVKLSSSGSFLMFSTYIGGSDEEDGEGVAVDPSGNVYVCGITRSDDFPTKVPFQLSLKGYRDAFVCKFNSGGALLYSTYLGGSSYDEGYGIAVDSSGSAYVTGYTNSDDFPIKNGYQTEENGWSDAFITKFSPDGTTLVYSTYLGGSRNDYGYGIAVDSDGCAYITGYTNSDDFPVKDGYQTEEDGWSKDAFITKFSPDGTTLAYSTYLGGSRDDYGYGIAVDSDGCAYITGYTYSEDFPVKSGYQIGKGESYDAFVSKFSKNGRELLYSTYLGGSRDDYGYGIAVDSSGSAYVTGYTYSDDFPVENGYQENYNGLIDAFVVKLSGEEIYFPVMGYGEGDQNVGYGFVNVSNLPVTLTFTPYDENGSMLFQPQEITIPPYGQIARELQTIFPDVYNGEEGWVKVSGDIFSLKGFFLFEGFSNGGLAGLDGTSGCEVGYDDLILPGVKTADGYMSTICVVNLMEESEDILIKGFSEDGEENHTIITIPPHGIYRGTPFSGFNGYFRVSGNQGDKLVATAIIRNTNESVTTMNGIAASHASKVLYAPHAVYWKDTYYTEIFLVNPSQTDANVEVIFYNEVKSGKSNHYEPLSFTLPANGVKILRNEELGLDTSGEKSLGWVKIESDVPLLGALEFGDPVNNRYRATLPLQSKGKKEIYFSQVANGNVGGINYWTGLAIINPNDEPATLNVEVYSSDGTKLGETGEITLDKNMKLINMLRGFQNLENLPDQSTGYIHIVSDKPLYAFELFGDDALNFMSSVPYE